MQGTWKALRPQPATKTYEIRYYGVYKNRAEGPTKLRPGRSAKLLFWLDALATEAEHDPLGKGDPLELEASPQ